MSIFLSGMPTCTFDKELEYVDFWQACHAPPQIQLSKNERGFLFEGCFIRFISPL